LPREDHDRHTDDSRSNDAQPSINGSLPQYQSSRSASLPASIGAFLAFTLPLDLYELRFEFLDSATNRRVLVGPTQESESFIMLACRKEFPCAFSDSLCLSVARLLLEQLALVDRKFFSLPGQLRPGGFQTPRQFGVVSYEPNSLGLFEPAGCLVGAPATQSLLGGRNQSIHLAPTRSFLFVAQSLLYLETLLLATARGHRLGLLTSLLLSDSLLLLLAFCLLLPSLFLSATGLSFSSSLFFLPLVSKALRLRPGEFRTPAEISVCRRLDSFVDPLQDQGGLFRPLIL
jgi:hypothetical protein